MEKELLSQHLRQKFYEKYGNVAEASRTIDISYERIKKALQLNKFPIDMLATILPILDISEDMTTLQERFSFSTSVGFTKRKRAKETEGASLTIEKLLSKADQILLNENPLIRERIKELIRRECAWARTIMKP